MRVSSRDCKGFVHTLIHVVRRTVAGGTVAISALLVVVVICVTFGGSRVKLTERS